MQAGETLLETQNSIQLSFLSEMLNFEIVFILMSFFPPMEIWFFCSSVLSPLNCGISDPRIWPLRLDLNHHHSWHNWECFENCLGENFLWGVGGDWEHTYPAGAHSLEERRVGLEFFPGRCLSLGR